ncbi:MAG TPA: 50S ribosomal protein L13 [Christensenellaceae bacterium]|nr:50S ribosomal protein L13 [Christensenellaceae bacterium]
MNTYMAKAESVERKWYVVDADGMVLGRLASQVASILRGKHKSIYTPHVDTGDYVIIINADKVVLTGKKLDQKYMYRHSGYPGGLKSTKYRHLMEDKPELAVKKAIVGMLPKGPLGRKMAKKLFVYAGSEHVHQAQQPELLPLKNFKGRSN